MSNKLFFVVQGPSVPDDLDAALSQAELGSLLKFAGAFLGGKYEVLSDPAVRDAKLAETLASGRDSVMCYREEVKEEVKVS